MLKSRVITATVLLALLLAALFALPPAAWAVLIVVMVMQGAVEWSRLSGFTGRKASLYWGLTLLLMLGLLWMDAGTTEAQRLQIHLAVYAVSALLWLIIVPAWLMVGWKVRQPVLMALTGWAVLVPTGLAMLDMRAASPWILLFVMCLVWIADIAAYFAGRKFGKRKLAPSISPGKTWEGVVGALLGVSVYVVLAWSFSPDFAHREVLPILLLASWWWVGLAVIGDLFESAVKRQAGVKDSGALLPGHGGLLDRIDALTSTLPLAALAMLLHKLG
ncbi:MAG: phosphatidate cytidylyltransferase [Gallionellales bacterium GWA2_55_18]|nr:MAG: phosphatidate cytidylyltransferase [Gallionellales bacterium GWA2_55_18]